MLNTLMSLIKILMRLCGKVSSLYFIREHKSSKSCIRDFEVKIKVFINSCQIVPDHLKRYSVEKAEE